MTQLQAKKDILEMVVQRVFQPHKTVNDYDLSGFPEIDQQALAEKLGDCYLTQARKIVIPKVKDATNNPDLNLIETRMEQEELLGKSLDFYLSAGKKEKADMLALTLAGPDCSDINLSMKAIDVLLDSTPEYQEQLQQRLTLGLRKSLGTGKYNRTAYLPKITEALVKLSGADYVNQIVDEYLQFSPEIESLFEVARTSNYYLNADFWTALEERAFASGEIIPFKKSLDCSNCYGIKVEPEYRKRRDLSQLKREAIEAGDSEKARAISWLQTGKEELSVTEHIILAHKLKTSFEIEHGPAREWVLHRTDNSYYKATEHLEQAGTPEAMETLAGWYIEMIQRSTQLPECIDIAERTINPCLRAGREDLAAQVLGEVKNIRVLEEGLKHCSKTDYPQFYQTCVTIGKELAQEYLSSDNLVDSAERIYALIKDAQGLETVKNKREEIRRGKILDNFPKQNRGVMGSYLETMGIYALSKLLGIK